MTLRAITRRHTTLETGEDVGPAVTLSCGHSIAWRAYRERDDRDGQYPCPVCAAERARALLASPSPMGRALRALAERRRPQSDLEQYIADRRAL